VSEKLAYKGLFAAAAQGNTAQIKTLIGKGKKSTRRTAAAHAAARRRFSARSTKPCARSSPQARPERARERPLRHRHHRRRRNDAQTLRVALELGGSARNITAATTAPP